MGEHCIYVITNKINGKQYVGQTNNFKRRMYGHCHNSKEDQVVDKAIKKYGKENFKFEIIEDDISINEIDEKEIYYINEVYDTYKGEGYNCHFGGNCQAGEHNPMYGLYGKDNPRYGQKHTMESKIKISKNHDDVSGENNPMYDLTGFKNPKCYITLEEFFKVIKLRIKGDFYKEIGFKLDLPEDLVNKICKNKHSVCKQIDFKFDFDVFDHYFNHKSPLNIKEVFLIRNFRKDKIPQLFISSLFGYSKSIVNSIDSENNNLCNLVDKEGEINKIVFDFLHDFNNQFNEVVKTNEETIIDFIDSFINYKEWFKKRFDLNYNVFCKYITKKNRSNLNISQIPKIFKLKKKMNYAELQKEIGISPSTACCILKGRHWFNDFLTEEGEFNDDFIKIKTFLKDLKVI